MGGLPKILNVLGAIIRSTYQPRTESEATGENAVRYLER